MALTRLDFSEEKEKYEAFEEQVEISFRKCDHSKVSIVANELRCTCGACWSGPQIYELYKLLTKQDVRPK